MINFDLYAFKTGQGRSQFRKETYCGKVSSAPKTGYLGFKRASGHYNPAGLVVIRANRNGRRDEQGTFAN